MTREEIIRYLDKPVTADKFYYDNLKDCIRIKFAYDTFDGFLTCKEIDQFSNCFIDNWFKGVIHSLYYRPNHYVLVLSGENQGDFFRDLFSQEEMYIDCHANYTTRSEFMYDRLVLELDFFKNTLDIAEKDDFKVIESFPTFYAEKRLSSYCSIVNKWPYPPRKNFIVLKVESINCELFNSINKHLLWIEIFNKFKPTDK